MERILIHSGRLAEIFLDISLLFWVWFLEELEKNLEDSMTFILAAIVEYKGLCRAREYKYRLDTILALTGSHCNQSY